MTRYQSYIICTSPRSGSTLLCGLLAATGISGKPDSHFHSPSVANWMTYYGISPDGFANDCELLKAVFRAARDRGTGDTGIFGLRMQGHSFEYFMQKLHVLFAERSLDSEIELIQETFGNTLYIHLTRQNKLDQAISLLVATQTGLWHKAPDGTELERTSAPQEPIYNSAAIAHHLKELTDMDANWCSWFAEEGLKPLRVNYDDLSDEPADVLAGILNHLGLDPAIALGITVPVAKLADATNEIWAKRYLAEKRS